MVVAAIACLLQRAIFTSHTLLESTLITTGIVFLSAKYKAGKLIAKYRLKPDGYSKRRKFADQLWITLSFSVIQPVCLAFLSGCAVLCPLKWFFPAALTPVANAIYAVNRFNEEHLKWVVLTLVSLLALSAALALISSFWSRKLSLLIKKATYPFKVIAIMACFVHADKGLSEQAIAWKMNREAIVTRTGVSFDSGDQSKPPPAAADGNTDDPKDAAGTERKKEKIRQIISLYVDIVTYNALEHPNADSINLGAPADFEQKMAGVAAEDLTLPFVQADLEKIDWYAQTQARWNTTPLLIHSPAFGPATAGKAPIITDEQEQRYPRDESYQENQNFITDFENAVAQDEPLFKDGAVADPALTQVAAAASEGYLDGILRILYDDASRIPDLGVEDGSVKVSLFKDMLKQWLGAVFEVAGTPDHVPLISSLRDAMFELFQEKTADGLFSLFSKKKVNRTDIREAEIYGESYLRQPAAKAIGQIGRRCTELDTYGFYFTSAFSLYQQESAQARTGNIDNLARLFSDFPDCGDQALYQQLQQWASQHTRSELNRLQLSSELQERLMTLCKTDPDYANRRPYGESPATPYGPDGRPLYGPSPDYPGHLPEPEPIPEPKPEPEGWLKSVSKWIPKEL